MSQINGDLLNKLLPPKSQAYTIDEVHRLLCIKRDEIEQLQRTNSDHFDTVLDSGTVERLKNLYQKLHDIQLAIMKLQCDIIYTKEQCINLKTICNNPLVQERRDMISQERELRGSLRRIKFAPLIDFFERLANVLLECIEENQKSCSQQQATPSQNQAFDWTHYHQAIFLLRVCGKALNDVNRFERLHQSDIEINSISFKQAIDKLDFNRFIDYQSTYSLEALLDVVTNLNRRQDVRDFMQDPRVESIVNANDVIDYSVFASSQSKLSQVTTMCCRLLIDLNLNYIEAHLTEGIDIDKLNNCENGAQPKLDEPTLPMYAFSPQEYITQIGQHLLTLRKQTEKFEDNDSQSIKLALSYLEIAHLDINVDLKQCSSVTEMILKCIAHLCIRSLLGRSTNSILSKLTPNGRRQLATDSLYLDNVLEDLRLLKSDEPNVAKFKALLSPQGAEGNESESR